MIYRLETIRVASLVGRFDFTDYAAERAVVRNISEPEIRVVRCRLP